MSPKARKDYTAQQKAEAVEIVLTTRQSVRQVARNLGIAESSLSRWVRERKGMTTVKRQGELSADERQELLQLRRQVKQLEMERDFLKKAAAMTRQLHWPVATITNPVFAIIVVWLAWQWSPKR